MVDQSTGRSYAQIDVLTLRRAIATLYTAERDVLDFIVSCADSRNIAFPGNKKIGDGCDLRIEEVIAIINRLVVGKWIGYVRKDEHDPLTRVQLPNAYMVNPDYMVLNQNSKYYEEAIKIARELFHKPESTNEESAESKTTAKSGLITTARNHRQEPPPFNHRQEAPTEPPPKEPTQKFLEGGATPKTAETPNDSNDGEERSHVDQPESESTAQRSAQESTDTVENGKWRVPPPPDGYAVPLRLQTAESLALRIYDAVAAVHGSRETSIVACRRLVDNYPSSASVALKALLRTQAQPGSNIRDAMAWITALARRHYQNQQQKLTPAADDDGDKYTGGEYGDFIQH